MRILVIAVLYVKKLDCDRYKTKYLCKSLQAWRSLDRGIMYTLGPPSRAVTWSEVRQTARDEVGKVRYLDIEPCRGHSGCRKHREGGRVPQVRYLVYSCSIILGTVDTTTPRDCGDGSRTPARITQGRRKKIDDDESE